MFIKNKLNKKPLPEVYNLLSMRFFTLFQAYFHSHLLPALQNGFSEKSIPNKRSAWKIFQL